MIKWGILGLGKMAEKFAEAIQEVTNAKLVSICSLSKQKTQLFGKKFNINDELRFNTYEDLINCKDVDAVYIATVLSAVTDFPDPLSPTKATVSPLLT